MTKKVSFSLFILFFVCSCSHKASKAPPSTPSFDSIISKSGHLYDSGYKDQSLDLVRSAHANAKNLSLTDEMNYLTCCNIIFGKNHQYDKSLGIADSMLLILEKKGSPDLTEQYIEAYSTKANALFALGLYNDAYDYYYKAQKLAKDNEDSCAIGNYSYILGMVLYKQQRFHESATRFVEAFNLSSACKDEFTTFYLKQEILDNIGLCYSNALQYDSAMIYYKKALEYIGDNFNRFPHKQPSVYTSAQAVVYGNMAAVYVAKGNYDTAISIYNNSIKINLQKGYANGDAIIDMVKLAGLYYKKNNIPEMKITLQDIKTALDSIPDTQVALSWNKLMWQYYSYEKDSINAYKYLSVYVSMNDSLNHKNQSVMEMDVDGRVKSAGKQYQIELLNKYNEQKKIYLLVTVLFLVMAVLIMLLILKNAKRSRNNVKTLIDLNNKVSEQKTKLEEALAQLELKDKDKSRILRSVAHDVMNPISAIVALTDILISEPANFSAEQKEILNLIKEACTNSLSLSKDILEAAVEVDGNNLSRKWVNITKLVTNSTDLLNIRAKAKNQDLVVTYSDDNIQAYVNKDKIWRAVNNLLTNAIKFSHSNSEIKVNVKLINGKVCISVKDTGIGIPEKNKKNIFDMFTDSKVPGTDGEIPHGMGLSISLQIARAHGGDIWFESEEGKGTTFYFEFPVR